MTFEYHSPIQPPQLTTDRFEKARLKYVAEHGYEIHIPGFREIIKWPRYREPTREELDLYKQANNSERKSKQYIKKLGEELYQRWKYAAEGSNDWFDRKESDDYFAAEFYEKDFDKLREQIGEIRYNEIYAWKGERRERYLRMLASPSPRIARNAAAVLTFIDDINDTMGTVGVVARTAHRMIPNQFLKVLLRRVGGYAFTIAELTGIAMALARNPLSAHRMQHVIHGGLHGNPPSRKLRARVMRRFGRHGISKGEMIEALQVSNNMFGYGLGLGGVFALLYDIPSGIYRHTKGETVRVTGLPRTLYWFDRLWSQNLKTLAEIWVAHEPWMDKMLGKSMVAAQMCYDMIKQTYGFNSAMSSLPNVADIETPIRMPIHPLTEEVIREETPNIEEYLNWPSTGKKWKAILQNWNYDLDEINENIRNWLSRNAFDAESYLCKQNMIESTFGMLSSIDGDAAVDWKFDSTSQSLLTALNDQYRFPEEMTEDQSTCYANLMGQYDSLDIDPGSAEIVRVANERCGIKMTTRVPWRPGPSSPDLAGQARNTIHRLKRWYFKTWARYLNNEYMFCQHRTSRGGDASMSKMSHYYQWLIYYGFPAGEPGREMSKVDDLTALLMNYCIDNLGARLYGRLDPYTPEKVKLIYDRLAGECPRFADIVYTWDDGIKLAYFSIKDCVLWSRMVDPVDWQRGYDNIIQSYFKTKERPFVYQFGTDYISG